MMTSVGRLPILMASFLWCVYLIPEPASAQGSGRPKWEKVVESSKTEGKLALFVPPGRPVRDTMTMFQNAFPHIQLEITAATGRVLIQRITAERKAGAYLWDIYIGGPGTLNHSLKPAGFLDPIKSALILPDVMDEKKWFGGFDDGFKDKEKKYAYGFQGDVSDYLWVNRDFIPENQLRFADELTQPRWKGKVAWRDPTLGVGAGASYAAYVLAARGEKFFREFVATASVISDDRRQVVEWLVRGQYPIAVAISSTELEPFWKQGVGKNVKPLDWSSHDVPVRIAAGSGVIAAINQPQNPNAAMVFLNWFLSKDGQEAWVRFTQRNSRRLDVTKIADTAPKMGRRYVDINVEELQHFQEAASKIAKEILK